MENSKIRPIDANALTTKLQEVIAHKGMGAAIAGLIIQLIESLPTIDAAPVVHCKDCMYRDTERCFAAPWEEDYKTLFDDDGFCSAGKKGARIEVFYFGPGALNSCDIHHAEEGEGWYATDFDAQQQRNIKTTVYESKEALKADLCSGKVSFS